VEGVELLESADTDFGIDAVGEIPPPPAPSPLGASYLILVVRELSGLSQRAIAHAIGTSQPTLATLETGNRVPTIRTLLRVADATGLELVIGLRRPNIPAPNPTELYAQGFDLLGTLKPNPQDGLADFVVLREPSPLEARADPRPQPDSRAARLSS
jgi:transcriptional regulator with XRE-family HTH domain